MRVMREFWKDHFHRLQLAPPVEVKSIVSFFGWLVDTKYKEKPPLSLLYADIRVHLCICTKSRECRCHLICVGRVRCIT